MTSIGAPSESPGTSLRSRDTSVRYGMATTDVPKWHGQVSQSTVQDKK
ncbi:MAG: hypothetical protein WB988_07925 [Candidatus Nitrosopolaris sp.]